MIAEYPRPGWGVRDPRVSSLLETHRPAAVVEHIWGGGQRIRCAAYPEPSDLPDEVVTSIRCIVRVGAQVVVCTNRDGLSHPWPGGRREPGETHAATACREVLEETGWTVDPATLELLGWLHMEKLDSPSAVDPFPHPDFLQYVYTGRATEGPNGRDPGWSDTEGYEVSSRLMSLEGAMKTLSEDPLAAPFLRMLQD